MSAADIDVDLDGIRSAARGVAQVAETKSPGASDAGNPGFRLSVSLNNWAQISDAKLSQLSGNARVLAEHLERTATAYEAADNAAGAVAKQIG